MLKAKAARSATSTSKPEVRGGDKYFSRAVSKALEVLELLQTESNSVTMNQIAVRLELSKTSVFRLLRTLETMGYVTLDGRGQYKLAPGMHAVAPTQWIAKLVRLAAPHLQVVNQDLSETVSLAALFENRVEVVAVFESPYDIRMSNVVGHILPPNASSLGKVITALQSPVQRERLLRSFKIYRFTEHTITDYRELSREYDRIRAQKYAIDREECSLDGVCFSVPICAAGGQTPAAISVSMPKSRLRDSHHELEILATIRHAAGLLAADLDRA